MGGVILCGRRTTKPYCIEGAGVNIYSIEELCYYLYNNVYMIGADFFTEELVKFIAEELELPALGQRLKQKKGSKSDVTSMVMDVMSATAYYSREECKNVEENIKKFGNMSKPERMKVKADLLVERKRYVSALLAYKELLDNRDELYNGEFVASIWNSMGVVYAKQFLFNDALKCFKTACDIDWKEQYVKNMISATVFAKDEDAMENVVT
jgi:tetratricopeptide (TPR) repeat protein